MFRSMHCFILSLDGINLGYLSLYVVIKAIPGFLEFGEGLVCESRHCVR